MDSGEVGHTTEGIGWKILQRIDCEPIEGLVKRQQGIITPIDAYVRKVRAGIAVHVPEKMTPNCLDDRCEQGIIQKDQNITYLCNGVAALEVKDKTLTMTESMESGNERSIKDWIKLILDDLSQMFSAQFMLEFRNLRDNNENFWLCNTEIDFISFKMKDHMASWNPLRQPKYHLELFRGWKNILECCKTLKFDKDDENLKPYEQLVWNSLMPFLKGAVREWDCRQPEPLIVLLEEWLPLLPTSILENVLQHDILPKLTLEVKQWNCTEDPPIQTWIQPWLPLLKSRLNTEIYLIIRKKLSLALRNWHPADGTAMLMLQSNAQVFSKRQMELFLMRNIVPKLKCALWGRENYSHQQDLEMWNQVCEWRNLLSVHAMVEILDKHFFREWKVGYWTHTRNPNDNGIIEWHMVSNPKT